MLGSRLECRQHRVGSGRNASTGGSAVRARSVEAATSVSTGGSAVSARSVEATVNIAVFIVLFRQMYFHLQKHLNADTIKSENT